MKETADEILALMDEACEQNDFDKIYSLSMKLYKLDPSIGSYWIGACHVNDWGIDGDYDIALEMFEKSIENGYEVAMSQYLGGVIFLNSEEYEVAIEWGKKAYEAGEKDAASIIGSAYLALEEYIEAIKWYKIAADNGDKTAFSYLGLAYSALDDNENAKKWLLKACDAGEADENTYSTLGSLYALEDDYCNAEKWLKKAIEAGNSNDYNALGNIYIVQKDYKRAIECLNEAYLEGVEGVMASLANNYFSMANDLRNYAAKQIRMDEYTESNTSAVYYYLKSQQLFYESAAYERSSLTAAHFVVWGKVVDMLYNLACRGELSVNNVTDNSLKSYLLNSVKLTMGSMNSEEHKKWWRNAMDACNIMDMCGFPIVGEYVRAACNLTDSDLHHSAEAYYRARWHLKRIGEMRSERGKYDPEDLVTIISSMNFVDDYAMEMDAKYGAAMRSMMASGKMPDLSPSYVSGTVPSPESCKKFMEMVRINKKSASEGVNKSENEAKGLGKIFGFFKKRG